MGQSQNEVSLKPYQPKTTMPLVSGNQPVAYGQPVAPGQPVAYGQPVDPGQPMAPEQPKVDDLFDIGPGWFQWCFCSFCCPLPTAYCLGKKMGESKAFLKYALSGKLNSILTAM